MAKKKQAPEEPKFDLTIHTDPTAATPPQIAILFAMLGEAWKLSRTFIAGGEGAGVDYPLHVVVEFGGKRVCGDVRPAGTLGGTSILASVPGLPPRPGTCN